ncbi:unnamed protein product, partial [Owenia fusiformis]
AASLSKGGRHCCGTGDGRPHRHHHTHGDEQGSQSSLGVNKQSSRSPSPSSESGHISQLRSKSPRSGESQELRRRSDPTVRRTDKHSQHNRTSSADEYKKGTTTGKATRGARIAAETDPMHSPFPRISSTPLMLVHQESTSGSSDMTDEGYTTSASVSLHHNACTWSPQSPVHPRKRWSNNRSNSLEIEDWYDRSLQGSNSSSPRLSPVPSGSRGSPRQFPTNLYVVMFTFKPREKDDLEIKAGWRVSTLETSDPDWWKGKCNGRVGFFPASYVERINYGEKVCQVTHSLQLNEGDNGVKLHRDQIVIQMSEEDQHGMVLIRTRDKRTMCPMKYLTEV